MGKKKRPRRSFTREFKLEAVRQVIEGNRPMTEVVKESVPVHRFLDKLLTVELTQREERRIKCGSGTDAMKRERL